MVDGSIGVELYADDKASPKLNKFTSQLLGLQTRSILGALGMAGLAVQTIRFGKSLIDTELSQARLNKNMTVGQAALINTSEAFKEQRKEIQGWFSKMNDSVVSAQNLRNAELEVDKAIRQGTKDIRDRQKAIDELQTKTILDAQAILAREGFAAAKAKERTPDQKFLEAWDASMQASTKAVNDNKAAREKLDKFVKLESQSVQREIELMGANTETKKALLEVDYKLADAIANVNEEFDKGIIKADEQATKIAFLTDWYEKLGIKIKDATKSSGELWNSGRVTREVEKDLKNSVSTKEEAKYTDEQLEKLKAGGNVKYQIAIDGKTLGQLMVAGG